MQYVFVCFCSFFDLLGGGEGEGGRCPVMQFGVSDPGLGASHFEGIVTTGAPKNLPSPTAYP